MDILHSIHWRVDVDVDVSLIFDRSLVITNRAIYNFTPKTYSKCNRRITLAQLRGLVYRRLPLPSAAISTVLSDTTIVALSDSV
jgi:hypothetical protein